MLWPYPSGERIERKAGQMAPFVCVRCGNCCRYLVFDTGYMVRGVRNLGEIKEHYGIRGVRVFESFDGVLTYEILFPCPEFIEGFGCKIYATRPESCRVFEGYGFDRCKGRR